MITWPTKSWHVRLVLLLLVAPIILGLPLPGLAGTSCEGDALIDARFDDGASWRLCWTSHVRENLVLEDVIYRPAVGPALPVLASAGLAQLHVAYDDNEVTYNDVTQYGLGGEFLQTLTAADCPGGELRKFDARAVLCLWRPGADRVSLFTVSQIGSYTYLITWTLHADGTIEPSIGASGALQRSSDDPDLPFGRVLAGDPGTLWLAHTHGYYWRLDFDLGDDAFDDTLIETRRDPTGDGPDSDVTTRLQREAALRRAPDLVQDWHLWESSPGNGQPPAGLRGYRIETPRPGHAFERAGVEPWSAHDLYVTVAKDCERYASQNERFNPDCADDVLQYVDGQLLTGADLVLWKRIAFHHVPRNEDRRHMHTHWDAFRLRPVNVVADAHASHGHPSDVQQQAQGEVPGATASVPGDEAAATTSGGSRQSRGGESLWLVPFALVVLAGRRLALACRSFRRAVRLPATRSRAPNNRAFGHRPRS